MRVEEIPLGKINPAPYNPRKELKPDDVQYRQIRRSLETFGLVKPLVWNERTGTLVEGHQRLNVLKSLGHDSAPCSIINVELKEEKALNISLNKINGLWDYPLFKENVVELDDGGGIDLLLLGFEDEAELEKMVTYDKSPEVTAVDPTPGKGNPEAVNTCPSCGHEF